MSFDNLTTLYTPRNMIEALVQEQAPSTFLLDRFVKKTNTLETDTIEIDVQKKGKTISAYVSREGEAVNVKKRGFVTNSHVAPYIYESITATPKDLKVRDLGENAYVRKTGKQRLDEKVGGWLGDLRNRRIRRQEQQLAEGIQTGKVVVSGKDVNYTVDYQMEAAHLPVNAGADIWGSTTEDKLAQMKADAKLIRDSGAGVAVDVTLGDEAAVDFINDSTILSFLDNRRVDMGEINIQLLADQNATYIGRIQYPGMALDIWSYAATYTDENDTEQYYIDPKKYVMSASSPRVETHYTTIENFRHGTMMGEEFPLWDISPNGKIATLSYESGPLTAVHQPDGFVCRTVKP